MQVIESHISRIQSKLQALLKKHATLRKESEQQQELIAKLQQEQAAKDKKIRLLEEQQYILKSAAGNLEGADKKAFEQTLSKYIREIDKCIALLSE